MPSLVARPAFFSTFCRPFFRKKSIAFSKLPSASVSALLQSIMAAQVISRSCFTSAAEMAMSLSPYLCILAQIRFLFYRGFWLNFGFLILVWCIFDLFFFLFFSPCHFCFNLTCFTFFYRFGNTVCDQVYGFKCIIITRNRKIHQ